MQDPEIQKMVERQEAERQVRREELRRAERPLALDLQAAGIAVDTAWELYKYPELGETAYPILLQHIRLDYPGRVLEGIARAFTKDVTRRHWQTLLNTYLGDARPDVRDGLGATLSRCALRTHYADLLSMVKNENLGESRIYFLRPINRIGNRMSAGQGRAVIEPLADDPVLGREATAILRGLSRNQ